MKRTAKVNPNVNRYSFNGWHYSRIDAGTHVFILCTPDTPVTACVPDKIEMYEKRRGIETFIGYANGMHYARLRDVFTAANVRDQRCR